MRSAKVAHHLVPAAIFALASLGGSAKAQFQQTYEKGPRYSLEPLRPGISSDRVFAELVAHNETRTADLLEYNSSRTYQVIDSNGKVRAEEIGRMEYRAPDKKTFVIASEGGSGIIRHLALNSLIASEIEAASGKQHQDSSITPANYTFNLLGEQQVGPNRCFVVQANPKRKDKYLFEGRVWIDAQDYAVVRIEGHPATKLSFWIERADFVRQYQKIEGFWLPLKDETFVQVRLYGKSVLTIEHKDYVVKSAVAGYATVQRVGNF
jgi:hypothetical protein